MNRCRHWLTLAIMLFATCSAPSCTPDECKLKCRPDPLVEGVYEFKNGDTIVVLDGGKVVVWTGFDRDIGQETTRIFDFDREQRGDECTGGVSLAVGIPTGT